MPCDFSMAFEVAEYQPGLGRGLELWLPSAVVSSPKKRMLENGGCEPQFPCEFPYEWGSPTSQLDLSLCPPVGAGAALSETDEEDDYMAGLAERVAYSMLDDDEDGFDDKLDVPSLKWPSGYDNPKRAMARPPQASLRSQGCWSTVNLKPASSALGVADDWDLLSQEVRLNVMGGDESMRDLAQVSLCKMPQQGLIGGPRGMRSLACSRPKVQWKPNAVPAPNRDFQHTVFRFSGADSSCNADSVRRKALSTRVRAEEGKYHAQQEPSQCLTSGMCWQARAAQAQPVRGRSCGAKKAASRPNQPGYPGQAAGGPGMRAIFLGSNGSGRESGGTGVFLPRRMNSGSHPKKPACSTVLLPARIVQALNLNVEDLHPQSLNVEDLHPQSFGSPDPSIRLNGWESGADHHRDALCQERSIPFCPVLPQLEQPSEISLPKEWTY